MDRPSDIGNLDLRLGKPSRAWWPDESGIHFVSRVYDILAIRPQRDSPPSKLLRPEVLQLDGSAKARTWSQATHALTYYRPALQRRTASPRQESALLAH